MRVAGRPVALFAVAMILILMLVVPASAGQLIRYQGETSGDPQANRIKLTVLKGDNGRRFIERFLVFFTLTCEDATTEQQGVGIQWIGRRGAPRIGEDGQFAIEDDLFGFSYISLNGIVRWRRAHGNLFVNEARLTEDHLDSRVCTTGELTWEAERVRASIARVAAVNVPRGTGFTKVRVENGIAKVVKRIEP